jgi:predicted dehydrogenase
MIRFGMIGAGGHATNAIYPSIRHSGMSLVAIADLDPALAERNAGWFGAQRTYGDFREMLDKEELDVVGVVGPPQMHHQIGLEVLRAARHLFMEKPPGRTLDDARELQAAAAENGVQCMVGFMKRFARSYARAKAISQTDEFGTPRLLRLNYSHWHYKPLREHLLFMSTHPLDLARFFMGDVVGGTVFKREVDGNHVIAAMLEHAEGGVSQLSLSALEPRVQEHLELSGDSTLIEVTNLTELRYHPPAPGFAEAVGTDESMVRLWLPEFTIPFPETDSLVLQGYAGELQELRAAIEEGRPVSSSIDDGVEAMRLVEAIDAAPAGLSVLELPA